MSARHATALAIVLLALTAPRLAPSELRFATTAAGAVVATGNTLGLAKQSGLQLSSKLLALASRVHDGASTVAR